MAKKDPKAFVTNEVLDDAVDSILRGLDNILKEQKKTFATKEDLKGFEARAMEQFATKEDLKREIMWVRDDIRGLKVELSDTPSEKEFNKLEKRVTKVEHRVASV